MPYVLYIDSDLSAARRMERTLRAAGFDFGVVANGLTAVELCSETAPDLIAVSGPLADLDVKALTLRLRRIPSVKDKPIVIVDDDEGVKDALAVGATGALAPDASPGEIVRTISRYLAGDRDAPDESSEMRLRHYSERLAERLELQIRALEDANTELEHLARLRSDLLRNLSHELATPLTPAIGYVTMLRSGAFGELGAQQRTALDAVATALTRVDHVMAMLRDVNSLERDGVRLHLTTFEVRRLADACEASFRARADDVTVEFNQGDRAVGDFGLLLRALERVIENSRKFGGVDAPISVEISVSDEGYEMAVADGGPGISHSGISRIGELFQQGDGSPTRRHGGVGLGLAFARRVIEAHPGGSLVVESPPSKVVAGLKLEGTLVMLRWKPA